MKSLRRHSRLDAVVAGYLGVDIAPGFPTGRPAIAASELFRPGKVPSIYNLYTFFSWRG